MDRVVTRIATVFLCVWLAATPALARKSRPPRVTWGLDVSAGVNYNDNVLGLSESDRNAFLRAPASFPTPLETADDLESEFELRPSLRWRAPSGLMVLSDYRLKLVNRARNPFTNYQTHTVNVSVRPRVSGYRWSAGFRVFAIPSFYLRAYRDRDNQNQHHATRFANWDYEGSVRYRLLRPVWIGVGAAYGTYYYNRKFTEYDSEYRDYAFNTIWEMPWGVRLDGSYTRRVSENVGKAQQGAVINSPIDPNEVGDSEYGDSDFNEDELNAGISRRLPFVKSPKISASVDGRYRRRVYTTNRSLDLDPFHRGRLDQRGRLKLGLEGELRKDLSVSLYFSYEARRTDSKAPTVSLVKDFTRREMGLAVSYSLR